jgi:hypothetical protein
MDADPTLPFATTSGTFVTDSHGLKVRTALLSAATHRPKRVKNVFSSVINC